MRRPARALLLAATALTALGGTQAAAQVVRTWDGTANNDWSAPDNWTPGPAPTNPDTARFDGVTGNANTVRSLVTTGTIDIRQIDVVSGAGAYSLNTSGQDTNIGQFAVGTSGVSVASGTSLNITNSGGGVMTFFNSAAASGNLTIANTGGGSGLDFLDSSNAGTTTITNAAGTNTTFNQNASAGSANITANNNSLVFFFNDSVAGNSTITSNGFSLVQFQDNANAQNANITLNGAFGEVRFWDSSSAGNSTITINNGFVSFGQSFGTDTATAGNATIINNSGLTFEASTTAGNATITTNNGADTLFGDNSTGGDARFIVNAGGLVDFSLSAGAGGLGVMTAGSIEGAGDIVIGDAHNLFRVGSNNLSTEFSGVICECFGPGALEKVGTGTLILSGANTYTGGTTITGGTLQIGNGGTTGAILGNIVNNSILAINLSSTSNFANNISGTGVLNHIGTGTTTLLGNNTYTGATNVTAGTLRAGGVNAFGNGSAVTVGANGTLALNNFNQTIGSLAGGGGVLLGSATLTVGSNNLSTNFSGVISGTGSLIKAGSGTWTLAGANTYTGPTDVTAGTLAAGVVNAFGVGSAVTVGANGTLALNNFNQTIGSLAGAGGVMLGSATLNVGGNNLSTDFSGIISGTGSLIKAGSGTWTLAGANTYTGATNVTAGTLAAGVVNAFGVGSAVTVGANGTLALNNFNQTIGSLAGAGGVMLGSAALNVGGNNLSTDFSGIVSGTGSLVKTGSGTMMLAGNNTYTGATTVNAGGLIVNGSIGSSSLLTVNNNTFVGGTGVLPSTTVSGTLAPGNSIGSITVQGNLVMTAAGTYAVEVSSTAADRINVSGTAALAGNVTIIPVGMLISQTYTILSAAGGLTGTFDALNASQLPPSIRARLSYTANDVLLTLVAGIAQTSGLNRNQRAVATGIDTAANAGVPLNAGFLTLFSLPGAALPGALTQLSGEVATGTSVAGMQLMNSFLGLMLNPFAEQRNSAGFGSAMADVYAAALPVKAPPPSLAQRWSVWGAAYGGVNTTKGEGVVIGSHDIAPRAYGFAAGADYRLAPRTIVGFALAGGGTSWSLSGGLGSGRSDAFQAGFYGSHQFGAAYISGALAYSWYDVSTDRTLTVAGTDMLHAGFNANNFGARIEGGYRVATPVVGVTPYAAVQVQTFHTPGYGETAAAGSAQFALNYGAQSSTATRTELGVWLDKSLAMQRGATLALRGRAAWANDQGDERIIGAAFQALPGSSFTVLGAAAPGNLALVTAGAELRLPSNLSFGAKFDGEFASRAQTYSGAGFVRYAW